MSSSTLLGGGFSRGFSSSFRLLSLLLLNLLTFRQISFQQLLLPSTLHDVLKTLCLLLARRRGIIGRTGHEGPVVRGVLPTCGEDGLVALPD